MQLGAGVPGDSRRRLGVRHVEQEAAREAVEAVAHEAQGGHACHLVLAVVSEALVEELRPLRGRPHNQIRLVVARQHLPPASPPGTARSHAAAPATCHLPPATCGDGVTQVSLRRRRSGVTRVSLFTGALWCRDVTKVSRACLLTARPTGWSRGGGGVTYV
eukprot:3449172-Pyramimonas_sp.AAC.1